MASTIDPVTGAPLVSAYPPDFNIDQIPLDSQPIPLKDLGATRPANRRLTYPDDAPAMTSLQGFGHKDQNAALQTYAPLAPVNVDHPVNAADVYIRGSDVSGGGGAVKYLSRFGSGTIAGVGTREQVFFGDGIATLYGVTLGFFKPEQAIVNGYSVSYYFADPFGNNPFHIASIGAVTTYSGPSTGAASAHAEIMFLTPIDVSDLFGTSQCYLFASYAGSTEPGESWAAVFYTPGVVE